MLAIMARDTSAQETPPALTGKLVVAPQTVEAGKTTLAVAFHVTPPDLEVSIEYPDLFAPEGQSCDSASAGSTPGATAPTWIELTACSAGEDTVRLVASDPRRVIAEVSVTVVEPRLIGQGEGEGLPLVRLSGVASTMEVGDSDDFTVAAGRLDRDSTYKLYIASLDAKSLAFDSGCADFAKTVDISGLNTYSGSHTIYACAPPGTDLWAYLRSNGRTVASSGIGANYVTVTAAPEPPRPPTITPTHTPTHTPTPIPTTEPPDPPRPPTRTPTPTPTFPALRAPTHAVSPDTASVAVRYVLPSPRGGFRYNLALYSSATGKFNDTRVHRHADVTNGNGRHSFTGLNLDHDSWYQVGLLACRNTGLRNCGNPALGSVWQPPRPHVQFGRAVGGPIEVGGSDAFRVQLSGLAPTATYSLSVKTDDGGDAAFDEGCSVFSKEFAGITGVAGRDIELRLHGCDVGDARVTATLTDGSVSVTVSFSVDVAAPPIARVTELAGRPGPGHGETALSWDADGNATGYEARQRKPPGQWIELPSGGFEIEFVGATAVVRNLDPDETYEYQVRGVNAHVEGAWSDSVETTPRDERPAAPTGLMGVTMRGGKGISLSWRAVADADGYEVESSFVGTTKTDTVSIASIPFFGMTPGAVYGFRARALKPHGGDHLYSGWSGAVSYTAPTPTHWEGHQEDHTVAYEAGSITSAPGLPAGVPDAATVISAAIEPAAAAWTTAAMAIAGKNLKICKVAACGDNHDGGIVTVKTEDTNTKDTGAISHDPDEGCGSSVACVKLGIPSSSSHSSNGPGNHLGNLWIIIEEPAWECKDPNAMAGGCPPGQHFRIYWTDKSGLNEEPGPGPDTQYYYIGSVMIHEFGHTLGLPDFDTDDVTSLKGRPAVMGDYHTNMMITAEDIAQLRAIYAVHDSSDH